ncbi:hypothetical protein K437DRAFT_275472 [Tilletiaria anomala UBC 951]|uniref:Uncharacterized protein n=1 Tax=Tilletiaria anomala (strain ATCC 24038 / CBS 436.72 / UBC 951) TaxID=1037660 RepID=A0A066VIK8_TILAU|nr:uncharacterized protein K437DRAFT_275472 [Tilletiaria anomala UBC 951]KDN41321.1 hypothetical protein K437DRAFT_275472 [Tilletiaria anomala UBC 951]
MGSSTSKPARKLGLTATTTQLPRSTAVRSSRPPSTTAAGGATIAKGAGKASIAAVTEAGKYTTSPSELATAVCTAEKTPLEGAPPVQAVASAEHEIGRGSRGAQQQQGFDMHSLARSRSARAAVQGQASEQKNQDILEDGRDPQLMRNLASLGPVHVPRNRLNFRRSDQMLGILAARQRESAFEYPFPSSPAAAQHAVAPSSSPLTSSDRMSTSTLALLLDARKDCRSRAEVERLAVEFDVNIELLDKLARRFNTPSFGEYVDKEQGNSVQAGEQRSPRRVYAIWEEAELVDAPKQIGA